MQLVKSWDNGSYWAEMYRYDLSSYIINFDNGCYYKSDNLNDVESMYTMYYTYNVGKQKFSVDRNYNGDW